MKKLKTIFATIAIATTLFTAAGAASASKLPDSTVTPYVILDPGTGGGGGK